MAYPTIAVNVSFGTSRYATPSFTTLPSADVQALDIDTGQHTELDGLNPGTLAVQLDNTARNYDPNATGGSHYPNVVPGKKVQVTATYSGTTYQLYNGWTTSWPNKYGLRTGVATLKAFGAFGYLQRAVCPDSYATTVLADSPTGYYRFTDVASHILTDSSGNNRHGHWYPDYLDVKTSDAVIKSDDLAVTLPGAPEVGEGLLPASVVPGLRPMSIEFWAKIDKIPKSLDEALYAGNQVFSTIVIGGGPNVRIYSVDGNFPGAIDWLITDSPVPSAWHTAESISVWSSSGVNAPGTYGICNGQPVHVVCTINAGGTAMAIYVNGVNRSFGAGVFSGTLNANPAYGPIHINWAAGWDGTAVLDELAFYSTALTATQVATHYAAGATPGLHDLTGARVGRILDLIGWPAALRDLEAGQTNLGVSEPAGSTALDYLTLVNNTEQGMLTESHHDSGKVRFQDRAGRLTDSRSSTVQTIFTDDFATLFFNVGAGYSAIDLATDDIPAANVVNVDWSGGTATVKNQTSIDAYGEIPITVKTLLETSDAANNLATWVVNEQSSLFTRVRSITIRPNEMSGTQADTAWVAVLSRQEGDRVRVIHTPTSSGTTIDQQSIVIGVEHHAADGVNHWETILHLRPAIMTAYWILGTSALGTGTVLSY